MCIRFFLPQPWILCRGVKGSSACKVSIITCVSLGLWTNRMLLTRTVSIWEKTSRESGEQTALSSQFRKKQKHLLGKAQLETQLHLITSRLQRERVVTACGVMTVFYQGEGDKMFILSEQNKGEIG